MSTSRSYHVVLDVEYAWFLGWMWIVLERETDLTWALLAGEAVSPAGSHRAISGGCGMCCSNIILLHSNNIILEWCCLLVGVECAVCWLGCGMCRFLVGMWIVLFLGWVWNVPVSWLDVGCAVFLVGCGVCCFLGWMWNVPGSWLGCGMCCFLGWVWNVPGFFVWFWSRGCARIMRARAREAEIRAWARISQTEVVEIFIILWISTTS